MFKKFAFKKLIIFTLSFFLLLIIYLFPDSDNYHYKTTLTYNSLDTMPIYLVDNYNYVSRVNVIKNNNEIDKLIEEVIDNLTITDNQYNHIPNKFKQIIPKNTKIINKSVDDGLLKINFTKEFFDVSKENEEKMLEAIIYSLTEIKGIEKIMIFVEGKNLQHLPKSNKNIPTILDKSFGINKVYDITSMKDVKKITTYYSSYYEGINYYTPITYVSNNKDEKIETIIEKLKSAPTYNANLVSHLKSKATLQKYEILENTINLSFNNEILSLEENKIIEEVKYSIALSIRDSYNKKEILFYIDDILMDVFLI